MAAPAVDLYFMPLQAMTAASLNALHRGDGSVTYSSNGYTVIAGVNGPMEVQRRDELPEEAAIDVAIRPASGVGGMLIKYKGGYSTESNAKGCVRDTLNQ